MTRLNITLPDEIAEKLESKSNKSGFIAEALREKFEQEKCERIEQLLAQGYKATNREDKKLNADWGKASLEQWD